MHHPILFGLLFGMLAMRFVMRLRRRRWAYAFAGGCGGRGGCGRWHDRGFHRGHRDDYEYPPDAWGWRGRHRGGGGGSSSGFDAAQRPAKTGNVSQRLDAVLGALELNRRQRDEAGEVIGSIRATLGDRFERWAHADVALRAVGAEPFDRAGAEAAIVALAEPDEHKELLDALEHLHNILTDDQRARLRGVTAA